jgi:hypothetical protein
MPKVLGSLSSIAKEKPSFKLGMVAHACNLLTPALKRLKQKNGEFKTSLACIVRCHLKKQNKQKSFSMTSLYKTRKALFGSPYLGELWQGAILRNSLLSETEILRGLEEGALTAWGKS